MQGIQNNPFYIVDEMINGILLAHGDIYEATSNSRVLKYRKAPISGKVGLVTGGGSGHEPSFLGYVGKNLIDAVAIGDIFSSPTPKDFYDAIVSANSGKGVLCLCGNYKGDEFNLGIAIDMAREKGILVGQIAANDDVASAPFEKMENRRGNCGIVFLWKVAGAMAAEGCSMEEIMEMVGRTKENCRSIGIGLQPCTIPAAGKPNFQINKGFMEFGIGHHGEPGVKSMKLETAVGMAELMLKSVLPELQLREGDEISMILSGLGSTTLMEQYVLFNELQRMLRARRLILYKPQIGNYFTSLDMKGVTLTVLKLDSEIKHLLDVRTNTVAYR